MSYDLKDEKEVPVSAGPNGKCKGPEVEKARGPKEKVSGAGAYSRSVALCEV